jgi:hypothetical protein
VARLLGPDLLFDQLNELGLHLVRAAARHSEEELLDEHVLPAGEPGRRAQRKHPLQAPAMRSWAGRAAT